MEVLVILMSFLIRITTSIPLLEEYISEKIFLVKKTNYIKFVNDIVCS